jgi:hypothetical protein
VCRSVVYVDDADLMTLVTDCRGRKVMEWRTIPSLPVYEVSEFGDVRRIGRGRGATAGRVKKSAIDRAGYRIFNLHMDDRQFARNAHRLVAEAFLGPPPFPDAQVCHHDGSRTNDHWTNLRWGTRSDNQTDRLRHGTHECGERNAQAKLTEREVRRIRERRAAGERLIPIAKDFSVSMQTISRIARRDLWWNLP